MNKIKNIKQNLMSFLKEEVLKTGLKKVTLGLSGGLDSAVVAVLCKEVFDDNLNCVLGYFKLRFNAITILIKIICWRCDRAL